MPQPRAADPSVSVIVPAFNVTRYIADALESVRAQTCTDYEVLVVNDGCPDTARLETALEPFRADIRYFKQPNSGVAAARNTAILASRAKYIALLDPDDIWEPCYLERQIGFLECHPEFDLVYPDAIIFGDSPQAGRRYMEVCPSIGEVTVASVLAATCNVYISVLGKRETFVRAGLFNPALRAAEDCELWLRILLMGGRIGYQREVLARRRKHTESLSADRGLQARRVVEALRQLLRHPAVRPDQMALMRRTIEQFAAVAELSEGKRAILDSRPEDAIRHLKAANRFFNSAKLAIALQALRFAPGLTRRCYRRRALSEARPSAV